MWLANICNGLITPKKKNIYTMPKVASLSGSNYNRKHFPKRSISPLPQNSKIQFTNSSKDLKTEVLILWRSRTPQKVGFKQLFSAKVLWDSCICSNFTEIESGMNNYQDSDSLFQGHNLPCWLTKLSLNGRQKMGPGVPNKSLQLVQDLTHFQVKQRVVSEKLRDT